MPQQHDLVGLFVIFSTAWETTTLQLNKVAVLEHVIRNDCELNNFGWYIVNSLLNWQLDSDNEQNVRKLSPPEQVEE